MPRPKKLRNASRKMAVGIVSAVVARMGPMALGIRWRETILSVDAPKAFAA